MSDRATAKKIVNTAVEEEQLAAIIISIGTRMSAILLTIGLALTFVAGIGCLGSLKRKKGLLESYAALVIFLAISNLALIIYISINKPIVMKRTNDYLFAKLSTGYEGQYENPTTPTLILDAIQIQFDCCGVYSFKDYEKASLWTERDYESYSNLMYPPSCCAWNSDEPKSFIPPFSFKDPQSCLDHSSGKTIDEKVIEAASNYKKPCSRELDSFATSQLGLVYAVASIGLVLEMGGIMAALLMRREQNRSD
ncbi:MAG: Tetraspanin [Paramarteilia canceri]